MKIRTALLRISGCLLLLIAMMWPAIYNRGPFFFSDTVTYIREADSIVQKLTHHTTDFTVPDSASIVPSSLEVGRSPKLHTADAVVARGVVAGRSVYYAFLLYLGVANGFWLPLVIQSAATLTGIFFALRAFNLQRWHVFFSISLIVAALSSLPFFVSFLLPDCLAGTSILACAILLTLKKRLALFDYGIWFFLLSAALLAHDSHLLTAVCLLGATVVWDLFSRSWTNWRGIVVVSAAFVVGTLGQSAFNAAVKHTTGSSTIRRPFITARTIEDGPGYRYLKMTCPGSGYVVCQFTDRLPVSAERFIFDQSGIFETASASVRAGLSSEQYRLFLAVFRFEPVEETIACLRDGGQQVVMMGFSDFNYALGMREVLDLRLPVRYLAGLHRSRAYLNENPVHFFQGLAYTIFVLSLLYLIRVLFIKKDSRLARFKEMFLLVCMGLVLNAALCGMLSGPYNRFQARVSWLMLFMALVLEAARRLENTNETLEP